MCSVSIKGLDSLRRLGIENTKPFHLEKPLIFTGFKTLFTDWHKKNLNFGQKIPTLDTMRYF